MVYTQCISKNDYLAFKHKIDNLHKNLLSIDIMAKPYLIDIDDNNFIIKSKNLDILLKKSINKAINAIKSSCYTYLLKNVQKKKLINY